MTEIRDFRAPFGQMLRYWSRASHPRKSAAQFRPPRNSIGSGSGPTANIRFSSKGAVIGQAHACSEPPQSVRRRATRYRYTAAHHRQISNPPALQDRHRRCIGKLRQFCCCPRREYTGFSTRSSCRIADQLLLGENDQVCTRCLRPPFEHRPGVAGKVADALVDLRHRDCQLVGHAITVYCPQTRRASRLSALVCRAR